MYAIARQYGVGVMDLVEWNKLDLQQGIKPGQIIKLRNPITETQVLPEISDVTVIEHIVRSTDTVYGIARKYGITIKDLMESNNKKDFTLAVGEKLKIPKK